ncbi:EamA family transporter [Jatrophihabitans lederbergiae]|uniref:EamA family transporter n=1 Tax=Jatrophihabitans lederbergiae TaxID=3075547 RepID=A0ABU2J7M6_9ACTN|nr:EamA family transporter [Jatrophihabitans sp. DSM 44399]MDT0260751.1 EamA family transporter [Jatrophihabitans sp. DSM 44399]
MAVLFALFAAAAYGVSDFLGGLASRRAAAVTVLLVSYPVGALLMAGALPFYGGPVTASTLWWSIAGGGAGLAGVALLYSALAQAPMNIISPVTAVMSAVVPVLGGVVQGERPHLLAWLGIALGLVAVVLISRQPEDHPHGPVGWRPLMMAVLAGVGFGAYFICLAQSDTDSGIWPVVISRGVSAVLLVPIAFAGSKFVRMSSGALGLAAVAGVLDAGANVAFLLASRHGLLSLSGVITALYPAGTVLLAVLILKEHTGRVQRAGLGLATAAVVLLTR